MASLQRQVDKLQTLGVNKIIALGHSGFTVDRDVARRVRGVDVVIGGHTNTFLYTGERWGGVHFIKILKAAGFLMFDSLAN